MKVFARVSGVAVLLLMALTLAFAAPVAAATAVGGGTLQLLSSTPNNGDANVPIENVGVKLFFNGDVTNESVWAANAKCFTLLDSGGNPVQGTPDTNNPDGSGCVAYPGQKEGEEGYILVLATPAAPKEGQPGQLAQISEYTLTVSGELTSADGAVLGEDMSVKFTTMDVAYNSKMSMILMVVMMGAVIALMVVTNGRKIKAEAEAAALLRANPYKIAKERNITIDEAKELIEKAKEKNRKKLEKVGGKAPVPEDKKSVAPRLDSKKKKKNVHKVKGPRPASEGGSTYKTGRKAEKEKKARVEAARKAAAAQHRSGARKTPKGGGKKR